MAEGRRLRPALARRDRDAALQDHHRPNAPRPDSARTKGRGQGRLQGAQPHDRSRHARLSKARLKPPGAPPLPPDLRLCTNAYPCRTMPICAPTPVAFTYRFHRRKHHMSSRFSGSNEPHFPLPISVTVDLPHRPQTPIAATASPPPSEEAWLAARRVARELDSIRSAGSVSGPGWRCLLNQSAVRSPLTSQGKNQASIFG